MNECLFSVNATMQTQALSTQAFCGSWGRCLAGEVDLGTDWKDKCEKSGVCWSSLNVSPVVSCSICSKSHGRQGKAWMQAWLKEKMEAIFFAFCYFCLQGELLLIIQHFHHTNLLNYSGWWNSLPRLLWMQCWQCVWRPKPLRKASSFWRCHQVKAESMGWVCVILQQKTQERRIEHNSKHWPIASAAGWCQVIEWQWVLGCFWFSFVDGWSCVVQLAPTCCTACRHAALPECQLQCWYL